MLSQLIILLLILNIKCQNWRDRRPSTRIQQGSIEGMKIYTDDGKFINAFLGIPYAKAPVGQNRFAPPQKHSGWNGTYQAIQFGPRCPQLPLKSGFSEDCLFLNIWTPETAGTYAFLPVVIFFEGKDFYQSSHLPISGQDLAVEGLVVVTLNYRLNIFGFFCLGTLEARGNLGMLDQYFGLLWVRENIKQFGGDPEKITLYGHMSGAVSVALHMTSPRTLGIFQRGIISSGSALSPWQLRNDPIIASKRILRLLNCDSLKCLQLRNVGQILTALSNYSKSHTWNDRFLPVVDNFLPKKYQYLPKDPSLALKDGTYLQVPILTGISRPIVDEQFTEWLQLASHGYNHLQQYTEKVKIHEILNLYGFSLNSREQIIDLINWKYFSSSLGEVRVLFEQLKKLEFEAKTFAPHFLQISHLISSHVQPIYVYFIDDIGLNLNTTDSVITTDLILLFGPILLKQMGRRRFNQNELNLSRKIKQFWLNFIVFGNPTPNHHLKLWRKYTTGDYYIEHFGTTEDEVKRGQIVTFWNQLLPKISNIRGFYNIPGELQNSPDPAAGFRHAMYTLIALVLALLILLLICIILLKKRFKERENLVHLGYFYQ